LATLEGLDVRGAIVRFNGKEDRYRHWLMDFVETVDQALSLIQEAIDVGDIDAATKVVHSFKGRVGMLGMTALQAEVSDLERLLRSGEDVEGMLGRVAQSAAGMRCRLQQALSRNGAGDMPGIEHVVWCDAFSVGVAEIDEQHKRLVGMINRLADCLQADTDCQFDEILSEMFDYSQVHFKSEEVYMARIGYPMLQEHEREHGAFIERISNLSIAAADGVRDMAGTYRFLRGWLLGHILKSDMQYRHFVERTIT
jgi:hemerythrin-like metal-binding protein